MQSPSTSHATQSHQVVNYQVPVQIMMAAPQEYRNKRCAAQNVNGACGESIRTDSCPSKKPAGAQGQATHRVKLIACDKQLLKVHIRGKHDAMLDSFCCRTA
jgi:hypothetical protein